MIPITKQPRFRIRGRLFFLWTGSILFIIGALTLSYVALTLLYAKHYQEAAGKTLSDQINAEEQHKAGLSQAVAKEGDVLGRIEIPRAQQHTHCGSELGISMVLLFQERTAASESPGIAIHTSAALRTFARMTISLSRRRLGIPRTR